MASASADDCERTTNYEKSAVEKKRKRSGFECAVGECSLRYADGVSMHSFPRDITYNHQWVNFVRTCRENFVPTKFSKICSVHFTSDCYPSSYAVRESLGFEVKFKQLLPTAVPTIQKYRQSKSTIVGKKLKENSIDKGISDLLIFPTSVQSTPFAVTSVTTTTTSSIQSCTTASKTTDSLKAPLMCVMETARADLGGSHCKRRIFKERKSESK